MSHPEASLALAHADLRKGLGMLDAAQAVRHYAAQEMQDIPEPMKQQRRTLMDLSATLIENQAKPILDRAFQQWQAYRQASAYEKV